MVNGGPVITGEGAPSPGKEAILCLQVESCFGLLS